MVTLEQVMKARHSPKELKKLFDVDKGNHQPTPVKKITPQAAKKVVKKAIKKASKKR